MNPAPNTVCKQALVDADLNSVDLRGVILDGANLKGANLLRTNLEGASLRGAVYDQATLWPADFLPHGWGAKLSW